MNTLEYFKTYLTILTGQDEIPEFVAQFLPYNTKTDKPTRTVSYRLNDLDALHAELSTHNPEKQYFSVAVNEQLVSNKRSKHNIKRLRGYCIDVDHFLPTQFLRELAETLQPTMVVKTSNNVYGDAKVHLYFLFEKDYNPTEESYSKTGDEIAEGISAYIRNKFKLAKDAKIVDKQLLLTSATCRSPGFYHCKQKPYTIVTCLEGAGYLNATDVLNLQMEYKEYADPTFKNITKGQKQTLENSRNVTLFKKACSLAKNPNLSVNDITIIIQNQNSALEDPLDDTEVGILINSALSYKAADIDFISDKKLTETEAIEYTVNSLKRVSITSQASIVERIVEKYKNSIIASEELGIFTYNTQKGLWENNETVLWEMFIKVVNDLEMEPSVRSFFTSSKTGTYKANFIKFVEKICNYHYFKQLKKSFVAYKELYIKNLSLKLDSEEFLISATNGVIDLRTGQLLEHNSDYLFSKQLACSYNFDRDNINNLANLNSKDEWIYNEGPAKQFIKFVYDISSGDLEVCRYLQKFFGYCLLSGNKQQLFHFFWGGGSNGKSVLLDTMRTIFGSFGRSVSSDVVINQGNNNATSNSTLAQLVGVRLVLASETKKDSVWDEALIKTLTGDKEITARKLYNESFNFEFNASIVIAGNHNPGIKADSFGVWRRFRKLGFLRKFEGKEKNVNLAQELLGLDKHESIDNPVTQEILSWLVAGCLLYKKEGLKSCTNIDNFTSEYKAEVSPFSLFVEENCKVLEDATATGIEVGELRQLFNKWARRDGIEPIRNNASLGKILSDAGYKTVKLPFDGEVLKYTNLIVKGEMQEKINAKDVRTPFF